MRSFLALTTLAAAAFIGVASTGVSFASGLTDVDLPAPSQVRNLPLGQVTDLHVPATAGAIYSNVDTFTGFGVTNGGAAADAGNGNLLTTQLLADDLNSSGGFFD